MGHYSLLMETNRSKAYRAEAKRIGIDRVIVGTPRAAFAEFSRQVTLLRYEHKTEEELRIGESEDDYGHR